METIGIVGIALVILALIAWAAISRMEQKPAPGLQESAKRVLERMHEKDLECRLSRIEEQADHLARVQLLILKELKKEHQVQPQRDVLVTIEPLPEFKNKERGR